MMKKIAMMAVLLAALLVPSVMKADDAGSWINVSALKSWDKVYAVARLEHRSFNGFSDTECWFGVAGAGLKLAPWLKADASYEYWHLSPQSSMHKLVATGTATMQRDGLAVSVREKLEYAFAPGASSGSFTLRSRLRAQYSISGSAFRPYAMAELFNWGSWQRSLYYAGTEISVGAHASLDLFYLYHIPAGKQSEHVVGLGLNFAF